MVKVGHAFSDYVISDTSQIKRRTGRTYSYVGLVPAVPFIILILVVAFLLIRLFYVQVLRGDYYAALADSNRTRTTLIPAARGVLFDHNGKPLVRNVPSFKILENGKVRILSREEALNLMSNGKKVENDVQREYLYNDAFAHVLGYIGQVSHDELLRPQFADYSVSDFDGKMGLEAQYETLLHGKNGKELNEIDAQGKQIRFLGKQEEQAGMDLKTTLDVELQLAARDAFPPDKKGAIVISDPRDGSIRALYSGPSFDPNLFTHPKEYTGKGKFKTLADVLMDGSTQPFLDRAIGGVYPPGSTFKLITATAALEQGAVNKDTIIEDNGTLKVGAFSFGNWYFIQYGRTEGPVDIVKAIKRSNDIYFYKAAEQTGVDKLSAWARKFNLGKKLGIDIPGEASGTVPDEAWKKEVIGEQWYLGDTYHYGIGQGFLLTTPLQVNAWTIPFANNGVLYKPYLIEGKTEVLKKDFIRPQDRELIRQGMLEACDTGGVAWPLFGFKVKNEHLPLDGKDYTPDASAGAQMVHVKIGCKTGTAETTNERKNHAWITVFAPFYNPEIVVTVLVEEGGEGSSDAGPIAEKILRRYFENKK